MQRSVIDDIGLKSNVARAVRSRILDARFYNCAANAAVAIAGWVATLPITQCLVA
jgi:hypothetical protein